MSSDELKSILDKAFRDAGYQVTPGKPPAVPAQALALVNNVVVALFDALNVEYIRICGGD